jgi:nitrogen fixation/metabolism regulation signal transduction histidine kinase
MHVLILLLAALAFFLFVTFKLARQPDLRRYFYFFVLIDAWISMVLVYLLVTAVVD